MSKQDAIDILCEVFSDRIDDVLASTCSQHSVVYDEYEFPVGAAIWDEYVDKDVPYIYVAWFGVRYSGAGFGGKVLRGLHEQFPKHWFSLACRKDNSNALGFYAHLGYKVTGDLPNFPNFFHLQRKPEQELCNVRRSEPEQQQPEPEQR